jgi:hypothetical protein
MEQTGVLHSDVDEGVDDGTLEEMLQMEQDTRDAHEYEETMEAHAETMHEVLVYTPPLCGCLLILSDR